MARTVISSTSKNPFLGQIDMVRFGFNRVSLIRTEFKLPYLNKIKVSNSNSISAKIETFYPFEQGYIGIENALYAYLYILFSEP